MKVAIFQFKLFGINTYVVYDPATLSCAIIDPGMMDSEEEEAMKGFIDKNNLKVTNIINTHLHLDHAVGNSFLKKEYEVPVLAHKDDAPLGERLRQQALMFGMNMDVDDVKVDRYLVDGETIKIGDGQLKVICVPGHSLGSIALYDAADHFVIVGDALFKGSIGRTDLPGGNYRQVIGSIKDRLLTFPGDTVVYPGHGEPTTISDEKMLNPFLNN